MSAQSDQTDFRYSLHRACGLTVDATISLRPPARSAAA